MSELGNLTLTFVHGSAVFGAARSEDPHRYDSIIAGMKARLQTVERKKR